MMLSPFSRMTRSLKENRDRLAARMRELETLHEVGRAVSTVLALDELLRRVTEEVVAVLGLESSALLLFDEQQRLVGVITAGDALWDVLPEEWRRETPRRVRAGSIAELASTGMNLEGIRHVMSLEQEVIRLREEVSQLRNLAAAAISEIERRTNVTGTDLVPLRQSIQLFTGQSGPFRPLR